MSSHQNSTIIPFKIDTGSDENIMPIHFFQNIVPRATKEQVVATKDKRIVLRTYNKTLLPQLDISGVSINNKCLADFLSCHKMVKLC